MMSVERLIAASQDPRIMNQPKWIREMIHDFSVRLTAEHAAVVGIQTRAEKEIDEARALLTDGPADSDTFQHLPSSLYSSAEDYEQRPLGKGAKIEFRAPGLSAGEGFEVRMSEDGSSLVIDGVNRLAVIPEDSHTIRIESR